MSATRAVKTPQSLKEIERFIAESTVDYEDAVNVHELRLQAYRTAFDAIMEELKTYRPVLAKIKMAYDASLNDAKETKRELDDTRQALLVISEKCEAKLAEHKQNQVQQLVEAKQEAENLRKNIKEYQEEKAWFQAQVDKLKLELSETYKQYRDERDARKILVAELRSQQASDSTDAEKEKQKDADQHKEFQDPTKLALALDVARADLKRITNELFNVKADYGDVVPRRDFETNQVKLENIETEIEGVRGDFEKLQSDHQALLSTQKEVQKERDDYFKQADLLRKDATPRPSWTEMAAVWPEGAEDWNEKTKNLTSNENVQFIAKEFKKNDGVHTLSVRGTGDDVPVHLRFEGPNNSSAELNVVHNRNFDRVQLTLWIDAIWSTKVAQKGVEESLSEIFLRYLKEKFNGCEDVVTEYAYSLDFALERFADEPHIKLFFDILYGRLHESIKYRHDYVIATARTAISAEAAELKRHGTTLDIDVIYEALKKVFTLKSEDDLEQMRGVLEAFDEEDHGGDIMNQTAAHETSDLGLYQFLFSQDDLGRRSRFLKMLVSQEERAKENFINELEVKFAGFTEISFGDVMELLRNIDPEKSPEDFKATMAAAFHAKTFSEAKEQATAGGLVHPQRILDGLRNAGVFRSGKPRDAQK